MVHRYWPKMTQVHVDCLFSTWLLSVNRPLLLNSSVQNPNPEPFSNASLRSFDPVWNAMLERRPSQLIRQVPWIRHLKDESWTRHLSISVSQKTLLGYLLDLHVNSTCQLLFHISPGAVDIVDIVTLFCSSRTSDWSTYCGLTPADHHEGSILATNMMHWQLCKLVLRSCGHTAHVYWRDEMHE